MRPQMLFAWHQTPHNLEASQKVKSSLDSPKDSKLGKKTIQIGKKLLNYILSWQ